MSRMTLHREYYTNRYSSITYDIHTNNYNTCNYYTNILLINTHTRLLHFIIFYDKNCLTSYIRLNWNKTTLPVKGKFAKITLPDQIQVSTLNKEITQQIKYDSHLFATLWIGMHGRNHAIPISINNRAERGEESNDPGIQSSEVIIT